MGRQVISAWFSKFHVLFSNSASFQVCSQPMTLPEGSFSWRIRFWNRKKSSSSWIFGTSSVLSKVIFHETWPCSSMTSATKTLTASKTFFLKPLSCLNVWTLSDLRGCPLIMSYDKGGGVSCLIMTNFFLLWHGEGGVMINYDKLKNWVCHNWPPGRWPNFGAFGARPGN